MYPILDLRARPEMKARAAAWFHEKWGVPPAAYLDSMDESLAGALLRRACRDLAEGGVHTAYLLTDHVGFYERCGWEYHCAVVSDGETAPCRVYVHRENPFS